MQYHCNTPSSSLLDTLAAKLFSLDRRDLILAGFCCGAVLGVDDVGKLAMARLTLEARLGRWRWPPRWPGMAKQEYANIITSTHLSMQSGSVIMWRNVSASLSAASIRDDFGMRLSTRHRRRRISVMMSTADCVDNEEATASWSKGLTLTSRKLLPGQHDSTALQHLWWFHRSASDRIQNSQAHVNVVDQLRSDWVHENNESTDHCGVCSATCCHLRLQDVGSLCVVTNEDTVAGGCIDDLHLRVRVMAASVTATVELTVKDAVVVADNFTSIKGCNDSTEASSARCRWLSQLAHRNKSTDANGQNYLDDWRDKALLVALGTSWSLLLGEQGVIDTAIIVAINRYCYWLLDCAQGDVNVLWRHYHDERDDNNNDGRHI